MSYDYAQLRAALANGPTPGPRSINEVGDSHRIVVRGGSVSGVMAFVETGWPHPEQQSEQRANALLIAAANPETICALLVERDAQAAEIERLKKALRVAVLALAHATEEHGKAYEPAYDAVQIALYGDPDAS